MAQQARSGRLFGYLFLFEKNRTRYLNSHSVGRNMSLKLALIIKMVIFFPILNGVLSFFFTSKKFEPVQYKAHTKQCKGGKHVFKGTEYFMEACTMDS